MLAVRARVARSAAGRAGPVGATRARRGAVGRSPPARSSAVDGVCGRLGRRDVTAVTVPSLIADDVTIARRIRYAFHRYDHAPSLRVVVLAPKRRSTNTHRSPHGAGDRWSRLLRREEAPTVAAEPLLVADFGCTSSPAKRRDWRPPWRAAGRSWSRTPTRSAATSTPPCSAAHPRPGTCSRSTWRSSAADCCARSCTWCRWSTGPTSWCGSSSSSDGTTASSMSSPSTTKRSGSRC